VTVLYRLPMDASAWPAAPEGAQSDSAGAPPPAGVLRRAAALVVDLAVVGALLEIGLALASLLARRALVAQALVQACVLVVPNAYFVLGHGTDGRTLGKLFLGVRVVGSGGGPIGYLHALGRQAAWWLSVLLFGAGFAVAAFRRDHRALHDLLAGTRVVRVVRGFGHSAIMGPK